jgi:hypothetical protein
MVMMNLTDMGSVTAVTLMTMNRSEFLKRVRHSLPEPRDHR